MTEQDLDLRTIFKTVRHYKVVVIVAALLGVLAGVGYAVVRPPLPSSTALVFLPTSNIHFIKTEIVLAKSNFVLTRAARLVSPPMTPVTLRSHVQATSLTPDIVALTGTAKTGAQAKSVANAVARVDVAVIGSKQKGVGEVPATLLLAKQVTQSSPTVQMLLMGSAGLLAGVIVGGIIAAGVGRNRRRLRRRKELAATVRAPVLASIDVRHPSTAADWMRLLEAYEPSAAAANGLARILERLGVGGVVPGQPGLDGENAITVISIDSDRRALALGPQLAAFAASRGVPTALVIGPQQAEKATANLLTACKAGPDSLRRRLPDLKMVVTPDGGDYWMQDAALVVVVCVVKRKAPRIADLPSATTLLAVSAGAATGEQLARIARWSAASGHRIDGIIVTNPDPLDETTGYAPQLVGSASRIQPTRTS